TLVPAVNPVTHICAAKELKGSVLLSAQLSGLASLKKIISPQEAISDFVLDNNHTIANVAVGLMLIAVLYLISILADGWRRLYITSDRKLQIETAERALQVPGKLQKEGNAAVLRADFARLCRRLMFAKTLGPVVGFALTVSSLIAALHPAVQADRDSLRFLSSLQLALVSTLVGLAMRIVAEFAIRMHRTATEQAIALEEIDSSSEKTS
ncbi:MAG: hypothetical protein KJZ78_25455, partial [Bryobacteraceae bacterium]|nr:hypothetical protein [Bryobacteraceae bacterium]